MGDSIISFEKEQNEKISKFKTKLYSDINEDEQSKNSKKYKSKKNTTKEGVKAKIEKESREIYENIAFNNKKNEKSKETFINNTIKNKKFLVNEEIKLQKAYEKKCVLETKIKSLKKKNIILYNLLKKNEKNRNILSKFVKKITNINSNINNICYRTDSEKKEISKIYELSTNKIMISSKEGKKKRI